MITFISNSGESCPIAQRMQQEGTKVQIYLHHPAYDDSFGNILSKVKLSELPRAVRKSKLVVFDHVRPHCGLKRDNALLRVFNCEPDQPSVFGPIAEKLRKRGINVLGTSKWTEQLELDRQFGTKIAQQLGFSVPVTYDFDRLSEARRFLENKKSLWVLKPHNNQDLDLTYVESFPGELEHRLQHDIPARVGKDRFPLMLQKRIEGVAISSEAWFDGEEFHYINHTYEDKTMMDGGLGPHIGSQSNTVWMHPRYLITDIFSKMFALAPLLREAGYIGPIDVNCIWNPEKERAYFLEWTPRFGYDALFNLLSLWTGKLEDFFAFKNDSLFESRRYACSQRVSIPPYPYEQEDQLKYAKQIEVRERVNDPRWWWQDVQLVNNNLQCAGADGIIAVSVGTGWSIGEAANNACTQSENIRIGSYKQYRTDQKERAYDAFEQLPFGFSRRQGNL